VASKRRARDGQSATGRSAKKRANARAAQPDRSELSAECPVAGPTTSRDCGKRTATLWALSTGVRKSSSPSRISVGTSGSGLGPKPGGLGAAGQRSQSASRSFSRIAPVSNGENEAAGRAAVAASAWRRLVEDDQVAAAKGRADRTEGVAREGADWPGPPASATTTPRLGRFNARMR
jgi:hypothetical protein